MKFSDQTKQTKSQRTLTRDGYLVVPATLSKVGVFDYLNKELGLQGDGVKKVARTEKSLFSDETIKSFENAALTIGHPAEGVSAKNWKGLSVGMVRNVRRVGDELHAEAWICDSEAIKTINEQGIEQLSCGYECDVQASTTEGADFEMTPMIGNHVAIVARGRCGDGVKLADEDKTIMGKTVQMLDALLGVFGIKLSDEQKKQVKEEDDETDKKNTPPSETPPPKKEEKDVEKAELEKQLKEKDDEIKRLKDEKVQREADTTRVTVLADAKASFNGLTLADNASVRDIHEQAVVSSGIFAKDEVAKMSDAELSGAYLAAKAAVKKLADRNLGSILIGDSKPASTGFNFNDYAK